MDEAQNFINDNFGTSIEEMRKYKFGIIACHHHYNQFSSTKIRSSLLSNATIKVVGMNSQQELDYINKRTGIEKNISQKKLKNFRFYVKVREKKAFIFKAPPTYQPKIFLRFRNPRFLSSRQEKKLDEDIIKRHQSYYKKIDTDPIESLFTLSKNQQEEKNALLPTPVTFANLPQPKYELRQWNEDNIINISYQSAISEVHKNIFQADVNKQHKILLWLSVYHYLTCKQLAQLQVSSNHK